MPIFRAGTSNRGYTLIELSLIILLIGVILVFVVPRLDNLGDSRLRTTARKISGTIQSVYDESIMKKRPYQIVFDIANRKYSYSEIRDEDASIISESAGEISLPDRIYIKDIILETGGKITEDKVFIRFFPDGYVEKNTIHISDGKKDYTLATMPLSGKVRISEGYVDVSDE